MIDRVGTGPQVDQGDISAVHPSRPRSKSLSDPSRDLADSPLFQLLALAVPGEVRGAMELVLRRHGNLEVHRVGMMRTETEAVPVSSFH